MKTKFFFLFASIVILSTAAFAQKSKIFIDKVQFGESFTEGNASMVSGAAEEVVLDEGRFEVVSEKLDAEYTLQLKLNSKTSTKGKYDDGRVYYTAGLNYNITVIDVATGKSIESKVCKPGIGTGGSLSAPMADTPEDAFAGLDALVKNNVERLINSALPLYGPVKDISLVKGKPKGVIIGIGQEMGVKKDRRVEIIKITSYGTEEKLAVINIASVGGGFSKCEGKASKKELKAIQEAFNSGEELKAKVIIPKVNLGGVISTAGGILGL